MLVISGGLASAEKTAITLVLTGQIGPASDRQSGFILVRLRQGVS